MNIDIVVARYNEDISWLDRIDYNKYLYNKGDAVSDHYDPINLENVGREAHTYLYHIIKNYTTLDPSGITIFTQGKYSDHINLMHKNDPHNSRNLLCLADIAEKDGIGFKSMANRLFPFDFRIPHWYTETFPSSYKFGDWFLKYIDNKVPNNFRFIPGAIFAVKNSIILSRSLEYYEKLFNIPDLHTKNPEVAHYFERSWIFIFNPSIIKDVL